MVYKGLKKIHDAPDTRLIPGKIVDRHLDRRVTENCAGKHPMAFGAGPTLYAISILI